MTAIVDYGVGNLFSLKSSLKMIGEEAIVTSDAEALRSAQRVILPGVGAFGDAIDKLRSTRLDKAVSESALSGKPLLGICLGMQLLFDRSFEYGEHRGLGLIPGEVVDMKELIPAELKTPHIGWNALHIEKPEHPLLRNTKEGECVYFVHSFCAVRCATSLLASAEYGAAITAVVARKNVMGCQFHPEKSGEAGLKILRAFCAMGGGV